MKSFVFPRQRDLIAITFFEFLGRLDLSVSGGGLGNEIYVEDFVVQGMLDNCLLTSRERIEA